MKSDGSARMPFAVFIIFAGLFLLPFIDKIFHELAPIGIKPKPAGSMQLRLSDLLLTGICYGVGLAIVALMQPGENRAFMIGAGYLLVSESLGLLAAMDVCRKTHKDYRNDFVQRSCIFFIFFLIFPLTLPAALLAWSRWSRWAA